MLLWAASPKLGIRWIVLILSRVSRLTEIDSGRADANVYSLVPVKNRDFRGWFGPNRRRVVAAKRQIHYKRNPGPKTSPESRYSYTYSELCSGLAQDQK
jgi:hypothetical protein